jgi:hypothetical protein
MFLIDGFDNLLGLENAKIISYQSHSALLITEMKMSPLLSLNANDESSVPQAIGIGAILALADVFTTLALLAKDPDHRPGNLKQLKKFESSIYVIF